MQVSVSDAKAQLTDLVRQAEAGEEIILTRHGQPTARLIPIRRRPTSEEKLAVLEQVTAAALKRGPDGGPCAARSADWLYGDDGLPA